MRSLISTALLLAASAPALAVPLQFSHQGRMFDALGTPVEGPHELTMSLYDAPNSGNRVWSESLVDVPFDNGFYTVVLGADEANPLDADLFGEDPLYLGLALDDNPELAGRVALNSVPFAVRALGAETAENVDGGVVDATEILVNGVPVIDASGTFVGATASGLDALSCLSGEIAVSDGTTWYCGDDAVLTEDDVLAFVTGGPVDLAAGSTVEGVAISTGDHLDRDDVRGHVTDGPIDLASGTSIGGVAVTPGPHTSRDDVRGYVADAAIDLATGSSVNGEAISTGAHTSRDDVRGFVTDTAIDLATGSSVNGAPILTSVHWDDVQGIPAGFADGTDDQRSNSYIRSAVSGLSIEWHSCAYTSCVDAPGLAACPAGKVMRGIAIGEMGGDQAACGNTDDYRAQCCSLRIQ